MKVHQQSGMLHSVTMSMSTDIAVMSSFICDYTRAVCYSWPFPCL
jgi:hypothetical protein